VQTPPPARPDAGQNVVPAQPAGSSTGRTIAIVIAAVVGALVALALIIVIAVAFIGRSASSQFEQIGGCVNDRGGATCSGVFPSPQP
jgi:uncharacterized RDD family membrane protein YckC